jgi:hypothetical protein
MAFGWRGFNMEVLDVAGVLWFFALWIGYWQFAERRDGRCGQNERSTSGNGTHRHEQFSDL